jgi:hypothetical protein
MKIINLTEKIISFKQRNQIVSCGRAVTASQTCACYSFCLLRRSSTEVLGDGFIRKHILPATEATTTLRHATPHRASPRRWCLSAFDVARATFLSAALLSSVALLANWPAAAQFACTVTPTDSTCTNTGNATTVELNNATGTNQCYHDQFRTAVGFASFTEGGRRRHRA